MDAVQEYTYGVRWSRADWVQPHLPRKGKLGFEPIAPPGVQVITCEVQSVKLVDGTNRAEVGVQLEWYLANQGTLRSSVLRQSWARSGDRWEIVGQRVTHGAPFPPPIPQRS